MRELRPFEQLPYDEVPELPRKPHRYFDAEVRELEVETSAFGRVRVHARSFGEGPPLVCVHGLMTTSYSYRYAMEPLGARFRVLAFDLVGAGRSGKPRAVYTADAMARSIGEIMKAFGVWGAPVVGNSMGGYLAMRLAYLEPTAMSRLACIHAPGVPTPRMDALAVAWAAVPGLESLLHKLVAKDPERWVHRNVHYFDESLKSREEHREYAHPLRDEDGRAAFFSMLRDTIAVKAMRQLVRRMREEPFPVPLLLVYAKKDPIVPPAVGDALAALLPSARLVKVDDASHFMHVDATDAFVRVTLPFLEEARGAGGAS